MIKLPTKGYIIHLPHGKLVVGLINGVYERIEAYCGKWVRNFTKGFDHLVKTIRTIRLG
jgi:hypothetical protein